MNSNQWNRLVDKTFQLWGIFCTLIGLILLGVFIVNILHEGITRIDWSFISNLPSRFANKTGIKTALAGSIWILFLTTLIAFPLGVAAGIYLEEYANTKSKLASIIEINISNLAGVPSVIYGLLGLTIFVKVMHLGNSLLSGALTLSLLILPIIIVATRESIKAVPKSIRDASYGLGASKWQTVWHQVLPSSIGGILTGVILAISRAVGETAPLIVIGVLASTRFVPLSPFEEFTVLPMQIYDWMGRPQKAFEENAAAAIIVLLFITFLMNGIAVFLRNRWQKNIKW